jgi:hypothetical protein
MRRASCLLRISAGQVQGVWEGASRSGSQRLEAAADFSTSEDAPTLRDAVDAVLAAILPPRRLTSPFVCVTLEGSLIMAAILPFAKLPKTEEDRRLVISQRFCREHRLEAGKFEVVGSPLHGPKTASPKTESGRILCLAVEQDVLRQIESALGGRGLYADIITPEYLQKFGQINGGELEKPGISLFEGNGFRTILVWDGEGAIAHIATVRRPARQDLEGQRRMAVRIKRYAQIVSRQDAPVALYIERRAAGDISKDLASSRGLKLLAWPGDGPDSRKGAPK